MSKQCKLNTVFFMSVDQHRHVRRPRPTGLGCDRVGVHSTNLSAMVFDKDQGFFVFSFRSTTATYDNTSLGSVLPQLKHETPTHAKRYYLNQGAQGWCESGRSTSDSTITESEYCQWEAWFVADVSGCLDLQDPERVRVLSVKRAAADAVLVHFRIGTSPNVLAGNTLILMQVFRVFCYQVRRAPIRGHTAFVVMRSGCSHEGSPFCYGTSPFY